MSREIERILTTIVATDVAGYSRLVRENEEATLKALRTHRRELFNPLIEKHGGRVANSAGDSLLIEFSSPVEAVRCAMAMQDGLAERNRNIPQSRQIHIRIGVNIGDVVKEGADLLGDGVNIAARLQTLAEPGGIFISRAVRDQIRDHLEVSLEDLGRIEVKNIARPVRIFRIIRPGRSGDVKQATNFPRRGRVVQKAGGGDRLLPGFTGHFRNLVVAANRFRTGRSDKNGVSASGQAFHCRAAVRQFVG